MVLKDGLLKLLKEKQMSAITVKEICEHADINRSTFYAHYSDPFDLLKQIEEELIEDLKMYLSTYNFEKEEEALQMTEKLIEYFAANQEKCQILLSENSDSSFENQVSLVARKFIMNKWVEVTEHDKDIFEYVSTFIVSGSIQVMKEWLNSGMDKTPKEMAEIIISLVTRGTGR